MPKPGLAARAVLSSCLLALWSRPGPGGEAVFAQAAEREFYVSAIDAEGKPVPDLSPSDVMVREDGVAREVLRVRRATAPIQLAILVDNSQAATQPMTDIRDALTRFVERMHPGNQIAVVSFGDRPTILADYTGSLAELNRGIGRLFAMPGSGAYLLDALVEITRGIARRESPRPVIVAIVTEQGTEFSNYPYEQVLERLQDSGAAFHAIVLTSSTANFLREEERHRNLTLDQGTRRTGGRRENLLSSMAIEGALEKLATELSNQYVVTYARPQALIPPERLEVAAARPGLVVRGTPVKAPKGQ